MKFEYDIIVVGGGHAGCEAASAAAKLGSHVLLITMDMTKFANMSCNPAVGGVAKGQIVREIDALGGQMGIITDRTSLQFRMLNRSKGPAMWSPRAQCDKDQFSVEWRRTLESIDNLYLWQDSVTGLITQPIDESENKIGMVSESDTMGGYDRDNSVLYRHRVCGVKTQMGAEFTARAVILTAGTFLNGMMFIGRNKTEGGRAGDSASFGLTEELIKLGFAVERMKTGTPARLDSRTIDFSVLEPQPGDENPSKFSFLPSVKPVDNQMPCYLAYTNEAVHDELREGFADSPLFGGMITGIGPRYCPSIEDKLRTFADKTSHHLFLEPETRSNSEYYVNGFSSSLPMDVQIRALQKVVGLENVHLLRPGYAVEYDYFPPTQLYHTLETKLVENLYFAGQVNGTTGYEEAAAQGLVAGVNAHSKLNDAPSLVLARDQAYIGVLIDDLVTKGVDEPYRMFTSRAEHRILLRQDNADLRLTPVGIEIGLVDGERASVFAQKKQLSESLIRFIRERSVTPAEIEEYLISNNSAPISHGRKLYDILLRNEVTLSGLIDVLCDLRDFVSANGISDEIIEGAEIQIKYHGYIEREKFVADKLKRLENIRIPSDFDFTSLKSLTIEARQKLGRIRPATIGQASRIPGVSPADINVLLVYFGR